MSQQLRGVRCATNAHVVFWWPSLQWHVLCIRSLDVFGCSECLNYVDDQPCKSDLWDLKWIVWNANDWLLKLIFHAWECWFTNDRIVLGYPVGGGSVQKLIWWNYWKCNFRWLRLWYRLRKCCTWRLLVYMLHVLSMGRLCTVVYMCNLQVATWPALKPPASLETSWLFMKPVDLLWPLLTWCITLLTWFITTNDYSVNIDGTFYGLQEQLR